METRAQFFKHIEQSLCGEKCPFEFIDPHRSSVRETPETVPCLSFSLSLSLSLSPSLSPWGLKSRMSFILFPRDRIERTRGYFLPYCSLFRLFVKIDLLREFIFILKYLKSNTSIVLTQVFCNFSSFKPQIYMVLRREKIFSRSEKIFTARRIPRICTLAGLGAKRKENLWIQFTSWAVASMG